MENRRGGRQGMPPQAVGRPGGKGMSPQAAGGPGGKGMPPQGAGRPGEGKGMPPQGAGRPGGKGMPPQGAGNPGGTNGLPPQAQFGIERLVLIVYTLYTIGLITYNDEELYSRWITYINLSSLLISWIFCLLRYRHYHFRATVTTISMHIMLFTSIIYREELYELLPYVCAIIILIGLYSLRDLIFISTMCMIGTACAYVFVLKQVDFSVQEEAVRFVAQMANVLVAEYLIYFWVGKRNEAMGNMKKVIFELKEAEDSRDDFLANVSHEIRTPINTICGISEVLLQKELPSDVRSELYYIQTAGRNLTSVVSDILDFSELQSGKIDLVEEEYNISSTVNDIINMSMAKIDKEKIEMIVNCDASIPSLLLGDEKKIRRVIMNLLDNAIKFTEEGCICLDVSYRKETYGINLIITVRDTGIGMAEADLEKLFNGFSQVDTRRNRRNGGVGLGLAISNIMVQRMGGMITMRSKPGQGTSMKIVIPQKVINEAPIVHLEEYDKCRFCSYINFEAFVSSKVRDERTRQIHQVIQQLKVKEHSCLNLAELKRRVQNEKYTHIIITFSEYQEDCAYFDALSEHTNVIVVIFREQEELLQNSKLLRLYKPFYILPLVSVVKGSLRGSKNKPVVLHKFSTKGVKALIVDDNLMNLKVMEGILRKYNISSVTANSGKACLQVIEERDFDLVFMDHMMPEMDGVETLHRIRAMAGNYYRNVPIVALTANTIAGAREMFLEEGFNDFIEKPVENSVLERLLLRNLSEDKIIYESEDGEIVEPVEEVKPLKPVEEQKTEVSEQPILEEASTVAEQPIVVEETSVQPEDVEAESNKGSTDPDTIGDLDKNMGITFCGGEENWIEILRVCGDTAQENKENLQNFFDTKNWKEYTILIHGVKSSMKTIGAMPLSEMAKALEMAGKEDNETYILEHHQEMMTEYDRVDAFLHASPRLYEQKTEEQLQKETEEQEQKVYSEITEEEFDEKIAELESAMFDFDGERMISILSGLQQKMFCDVPLDKPLNALIRKVEMSDFMSAYDTLTKVKEELVKKNGKE